MDALEQILIKLKHAESIDLKALKALKAKDLEALTEEIKYWCLYGNGKPEKLGKQHRKY
ncbi:hypothetical protein [Polynucleobacter sp.]|uniref:hypothetical protein n=1 Tax=Polynucleobacter sp. TaxID=2029855 RepID=UPI00333F5A42